MKDFKSSGETILIMLVNFSGGSPPLSYKQAFTAVIKFQINSSIKTSGNPCFEHFGYL